MLTVHLLLRIHFKNKETLKPSLFAPLEAPQLFCPNCGFKVGEGFVFCPNCRYDLRGISEQANAIAGDIASYQKYSKMRVFTDNVISPRWVLAQVIALIGYGVFFAYELYAVANAFRSIAASPSPAPPSITSLGFVDYNAAYLASLASDVFLLYFFYIIIRRRNQHFERQSRMFGSLNAVIRKIGYSKGISDVSVYSGYVDVALNNAASREREKSGAFFVALMLVPLVNIIAFFYVLAFLTQDFRQHEDTEDYVLADFVYELHLIGVDFSFKRQNPVPKRSSAAYVLLTMFTLGIFSIYWEYVLIKDENGHIADQVTIEDNLTSTITPLITV
jgi:hypothetical protein